MKAKTLFLVGIVALLALFSISAASAYYETSPGGSTHWVPECYGSSCGGGSWHSNWGTWFSNSRDYSGYDYNYGKFNYPPRSNTGGWEFHSNWGTWFSNTRDYSGFDYNYGKFNYPCW